MPKLQMVGAGRRCLLVGVGTGSAVYRALAEVGFGLETAGSEEDVRQRLEHEEYAAVVAMQNLGGRAVRAICASAGQHHPPLPCVVLGLSATLQDAVDAMQQGAADFVPPPHAGEVLVERLLKLLGPAARPDDGLAPSGDHLGPSHLGLVGHSPAMARVHATLAKVSRYKTNVLLLGESGSGKELVARALHAAGPRRKRLFVPINCATLGREILENELFGHERGAFTGANERKKGLFEMADGGTLMLDEIGELDPSTQAKLLRVLERNEFRRVGGTTKVKVDLGLIAATNRNLEDAIAAGRFREDLYFRLKVVTIVVPPLRERREDIGPLVEAFIADFNRRNNGKIRGITPAALRTLTSYDWPGNVRELKNAVESAAVLATGETMGPADFEALGWRSRSPRLLTPPAEPPPAVPIEPTATLAEVERSMIRDRLARSRTKADAARSLGIGVRTLYTKLRELSRAEAAPTRGPRGSGP
jgi:DNA-binding NtrC family response regulator